MLPAELIAAKRDGAMLSDNEIQWFIRGYVDETITDYQMSAMAMAICCRGMTPGETAAMTNAIVDSGIRLPRREPSDNCKPRVDKHSTGGLGDKVSLILAPLLAECGADVPMISGRGLGLTGGTLDKLEAIPGYTCDLSLDRSCEVLRDVGCHIVAADQRLAPADRRLYALRDVTGTVASIPLITSSILGKKLAASLDALVMDVKFGSAAFMKTLDNARALGQSIVNTAAAAGLHTTALLTDMDQPLGTAIGNAIEVNESMAVLRGGGPDTTRQLTLQLCAPLLVQTNLATDPDAAISMLTRHLDSGAALDRFMRMLSAQGSHWDGGNLPVYDPVTITAADDGYVQSVDCIALGRLVVEMGGGRKTLGDAIDHASGIRVHVRVGDRVNRGDVIMHLHAPDGQNTQMEQQICQRSVRLVEQRIQARPLIVDTQQTAFPPNSASLADASG
ncbi:MAG: thymidine phosphorylase [Planctomycetota bacterium]